ncbi:nucleoside recognition domain-containing protein [Clostridium fallax]|uniref:Spore maturation protein A n=1 Tax=Clostridium fallax TaxID=1533 RepID=A0A1M4T930_9CLOT|nr:nucleoside recognition domain-containing protein [Clostridium fallax]SHE41013.1 spore maturation protein A [Clostridium fallax]SQB22658.1 nucleoside recognition domain-containing protein [Clostridium fallax]
MINYIWFFMVFLGGLLGIILGKGEIITKAIVEASDSTTKLIIGFIGTMCFWSGTMKVAEKSGLTNKLANILKPILKKIFKDVSKDEKALGAIVMNITANMLGLSNAATPFGIKAMEEMDRLNNKKGVASNDMVLFLVINAACIQFVPSTIISIRAAEGSLNPGIIILPAILSTAISCLVGIIICKVLQKYF